MRLDRRALLLSALALASCAGADARSQPVGRTPPLREVLPFPLGTSIMTGQLADGQHAVLTRTHFSQLTPEWELKMEYVLQPDGSYRFDAPDRIAALAQANGQRFYGTTLVWYSQENPAFRALDGRRDAFARAYRNYILAVCRRYAGRAVAWDVVNEPVAEDGSGLREHLWSRNLGRTEHMVAAFRHAEEADPAALRVLNEYHLESRPAKRATFLRLTEQLLAAGAPVSCLGTQTHLMVGQPVADIGATIRALAAFGLPVHISELDISLQGESRFTPARELVDRQARLVGAVLEAFAALPERQRFALTLWGVRDSDSWLRGPAGGNPLTPDRPLLFDDDGQPKPAFWSLARSGSAEGGTA